MKRNFLGILLLTFLFVGTSLAQSKQVKVKVDGLSCPFCAYGLEKKFKDVDGIEDIKIDIKEGTLSFLLEEGKIFPEEQIRKKVKQAGFTPKEITYPETSVKNEKGKIHP